MSACEPMVGVVTHRLHTLTAVVVCVAWRNWTLTLALFWGGQWTRCWRLQTCLASTSKQ